MLFEKKEKDIKKKHYAYDDDFQIERDEYLVPLYFVNEGKRKGRIMIEKQCYDHCVILWSVKIYENYRGKGFGTQMLNETLDYIKEKMPKVREIGLKVHCDNAIAISLYEKIGFTILKEYSGIDYYFMEKIIKKP